MKKDFVRYETIESDDSKYFINLKYEVMLSSENDKYLITITRIEINRKLWWSLRTKKIREPILVIIDGHYIEFAQNITPDGDIGVKIMNRGKILNRGKNNEKGKK